AVPVSAATSVSSGAHAITRIARSLARAEVAKEERTRSCVEIMGWRAWTLVPGEECLRSVSYNHVIWDGPVLHADAIPTARNPNGVYAVHIPNNVPWTRIWGEVALSGTVVEGENGYRGEVATIRSLYIAR